MKITFEATPAELNNFIRIFLTDESTPLPRQVSRQPKENEEFDIPF